MTTIAYRDGLLCADTMAIHSNGLKMYVATKVFKVPDGWVSGCGNPRDIAKFVEMYKEGVLEADTFNGEDWEIIKVNTKGKFELWNHELVPLSIKGRFYATGSGSSYAMGAMEQGATAYEAVQVSCKYDDGTGGTVTTVKCIS